MELLIRFPLKVISVFSDKQLSRQTALLLLKDSRLYSFWGKKKRNNPPPKQIKGLNILLFVIQYQNEIICAETIVTLMKEKIRFVILLEKYTQSLLNSKGVLMSFFS